MNTSKDKERLKKAMKNYNDNLHVVEEVLKQRKKKGKLQYLVKWKGYSNKYNSWEPKSAFKYIEEMSHERRVPAKHRHTHKSNRVSMKEHSSSKSNVRDLTESMTNNKKIDRSICSEKSLELEKGSRTYKPKAKKGAKHLHQRINYLETDKKYEDKKVVPMEGTPICQNTNEKMRSGNKKLVIPKLVKAKHNINSESQSNVDGAINDEYTYIVREAIGFISKVIDKHGKGFASDDALVLAVVLYVQTTKKFNENVAQIYKKVKSANIPMELFFKLKMHEPKSEGHRSDKELMDKLMEEFGKLK